MRKVTDSVFFTVASHFCVSSTEATIKCPNKDDSLRLALGVYVCVSAVKLAKCLLFAGYSSSTFPVCGFQRVCVCVNTVRIPAMLTFEVARGAQGRGEESVSC